VDAAPVLPVAEAQARAAALRRSRILNGRLRTKRRHHDRRGF